MWYTCIGFSADQDLDRKYITDYHSYNYDSVKESINSFVRNNIIVSIDTRDPRASLVTIYNYNLLDTKIKCNIDYER
jgi:hypothetical protein